MSPAATISWDAVRRRLEAAQAAVEPGGAIAPEAGKAILKERARALAKEPRNEAMAGRQVEIVEFVLAHERYGLESSFIREVYPLREFTPVPGTPPFVLGIINVRGEIISVIDLKKFFDLPEKGITDLNKVIVLRNEEMEFGILADAVPGAGLISLAGLQPPPRMFTGAREAYLLGITGERVAILNAARLLADPKLIIQEETETRREPQ